MLLTMHKKIWLAEIVEQNPADRLPPNFPVACGQTFLFL
jgi:hypothetical protein